MNYTKNIKSVKSRLQQTLRAKWAGVRKEIKGWGNRLKKIQNKYEDFTNWTSLNYNVLLGDKIISKCEEMITIKFRFRIAFVGRKEVVLR